jgi:hypothetical protein
MAAARLRLNATPHGQAAVAGRKRHEPAGITGDHERDAVRVAA